MNEFLLIVCIIAIVALMGEAYVAYKRTKEAKQLKNELSSKANVYKEMIDRHTKDLKEHFANKEKLVLEFKTITDKLREEKDSTKTFYETELKKMKEIYNAELGHRKSSEVRLGRISESLAPFLNGWPWDPNEFRFLGNPIDGIQFNQDEIIFVEIKTGKSRLSASQRWIKDLISQGKVSFATFRISENGSTLTKENGNERLEEKEN